MLDHSKVIDPVSDDSCFDALLDDLMSSDCGVPRCFQSWKISDVKIVTLVTKDAVECKSCPQRADCRLSAPADYLDLIAKPPCFGGGPHQVVPGQYCAAHKCGVADQCQAAYAQLFARREFDFIENARKASAAFIDRAQPPAPPVPLSGEEIKVTAPEALGSECHGDPKPSVVKVVITEAPIALPYDERRYDLAAKDYQGLEVDALLSTIQQLSHGYLDSPEGECPGYAALREKFLAASFLANEHGSYAPRFREVKALTRLASDLPYLRDLQLVDLHWLSLWGSPNPIHEFEGIFEGDGFSQAEAWKFVCREARPEMKTRLLGLGGIEEHQLKVLRREDVRMVWKRFHEKRDDVFRKVKRALQNSKTRTKVSPTMFYDIYRAYLVSDRSLTVAGKFLCHMGYPSLTSTEMRRCIDWLTKAGVIKAA